jgi:hypothetical protein
MPKSKTIHPDGSVHGQQKTVRLTQERRRQLVGDMVLMDWSYREIAQELDIAIGTVHNDVQALQEEWREERIETIDQLKKKQLRRLGRLRARAWKRVEAGESGAIGEALKVEQEYNKISGIYAPAVLEMQGAGGAPLFSNAMLVAAMRASEEGQDDFPSDE